MKRLNHTVELYKKTGIYCIENLTNNKKYIGLAKVGFRRRYDYHKNRLKNSKHPNKHLQNAYNKYGIDSFQFSIIEFININIILSFFKEREVFYIDKFDTYKNGYNQTLGGDYTINSTGLIISYNISNDNKSITFNFNKKYISAAEVGRDLNYENGHIARLINGEINSTKLKDYIFLTENEVLENNLVNDDLIQKFLLEKYNKIQGLPIKGHAIQFYVNNEELRKKVAKQQEKRIYQFDLNGNFIRYYNSINEASDDLGIGPSNISHVLSGKQKSSAQSTFKLEKDISKDLLIEYNKKEIPNKTKFQKQGNIKAIDLFDLNGIFIKRYNTLKECAIDLNVSPPSISACLNGKQKTVKKCIIKLAN